MTRLQRIQWVAAVAANCQLAAAVKRAANVYRVAMFIVMAYDEEAGDFAYGKEKIARRLGIATSTAQRALAALAKAGCLVLARGPSRGRNATAYHLVCPTVQPTDTAGQLDAKEPTDIASRLESEQPTDSRRSTDRRRVSNRPISTRQPTDDVGRYQRDHVMDQASARIAGIAPVVEASEVASVGPTFSLRCGGTWQLSADQHRRLIAAHPAIDADDELAKAALWCEANPGKRKTRSGMLRFLAGWFGRSRAAEAPALAGLSESEIDEMLSADPAAIGEGDARG